jgi:putative phage-type endonuclease
MVVFTTDLEELKDVFDEVTAVPSLSDAEREELAESCVQLIMSYLEQNPLVFIKADYVKQIKESVFELLFETLDLTDSEVNEEERHLAFQKAIYTVFTHIVPRRSYSKTFVRNLRSKQRIKEKLADIRARPQAEQCTPQWYMDRWNRLSGSNAWKAFGSDSQRNSLIVEKCKPLNVDKYKSFNIDSPLHHGKRFEQVSVQYYEHKYGAKVEEFGCVPHARYQFLGASPDGIIVNQENPRFGRMLEIKNVTTRKITGIPKEEYWVQMQIQMEVCNLNECDFLETEIFSYESYDDFKNDGTFTTSADGKYKGLIMFFMVNGQPHYEYAPFQCEEEESDKWQEEMMEAHKDDSWVSNIYYRIDKISCVLVLRNKLWAREAIKQLGELWDVILHEREHGYDHRLPKPRAKVVKSSIIKLDDLGQPISNPHTGLLDGPMPCVLLDQMAHPEPETDPDEAAVQSDKQGPSNQPDAREQNDDQNTKSQKRPRKNNEVMTLFVDT